MFSFGSKRVSTSTKPVIRNPLAVIPVRPDCVELKHDYAGHIHLCLNSSPKGLSGRIAKIVGYDYTRKLQLDEYGSFYYSLVNGTNTLKTIVGKMAVQFNKEDKQMEENVILFTKKLMVMNMLVLKVPSSSAPSESP
jgi:hypothetical protein